MIDFGPPCGGPLFYLSLVVVFLASCASCSKAAICFRVMSAAASCLLSFATSGALASSQNLASCSGVSLVSMVSPLCDWLTTVCNIIVSCAFVKYLLSVFVRVSYPVLVRLVLPCFSTANPDERAYPPCGGPCGHIPFLVYMCPLTPSSRCLSLPSLSRGKPCIVVLSVVGPRPGSSGSLVGSLVVKTLRSCAVAGGCSYAVLSPYPGSARGGRRCAFASSRWRGEFVLAVQHVHRLSDSARDGMGAPLYARGCGLRSQFVSHVDL